MDLLDSPVFAAKIENLMQKWDIPGFAIATISEDKISQKAYGMASIEPPRQCTPDTIFDIASLSKSFTAAAVALLVEDDKYTQVQWTTPVSQILPEFVMSEQSYTADVTVEDILSHRSGLPSLGLNATQPDTVKSLVENLRNLPVAAPIRSKFMYCNLMYTMATYLVEQVSGQSFEAFLRQHFFVPLKMASTYLQPGAVKAGGDADRMATPYHWNKSTKTYDTLPYLPAPESQGAGLVFTSVSDHIRWIRAMMLKQGPVSEEVYKGILRPRILLDADEDVKQYTSWTAYGAGWEVRYYRGVCIVKHDGLTTGFGSNHFFIPEFKFGGVAFGNSENANDLACLTHHLLIDEVLQVPEAERPDWIATFQKAFDDYSIEEKVMKVKEERFDGIEEPEALMTSYEAYTGHYWNDGYRKIEILVKEEQLYVDGIDRSMPITLTFEHMRGQTQFLVRRNDYFEGAVDIVRAEFRLEGGSAVEVGIEMETDQEELTWFRRMVRT